MDFSTETCTECHKFYICSKYFKTKLCNECRKKQNISTATDIKIFELTDLLSDIKETEKSIIHYEQTLTNLRKKKDRLWNKYHNKRTAALLLKLDDQRKARLEDEMQTMFKDYNEFKKGKRRVIDLTSNEELLSEGLGCNKKQRTDNDTDSDSDSG